MAAHRSGRGERPGRRLAPGIESLDTRALLSLTGFGPHLGHYVQPGLVPPEARARPLRPGLTVNAHVAINRALIPLLGPGLDRIERFTELNQIAEHSGLGQQVLGQPFVHAVLSNNDTYTLLGGPLLANILGAQSLGTSQDQVVTLHLPKGDLQALGNPSVVMVNPGDPAPGPPGTTFQNGFLVQVPASAIIFDADNQHIDVTVPVSEIPSGAQVLSNANPNNLAGIYSTTAPQILNLFRSGLPQTAPTALPTVPGLRLVDALSRNHPFPSPESGRFFRSMRIAADDNIFALNNDQANLVNAGLKQFLSVADNWNALSSAQLSALLTTRSSGQIAPVLPRGPLKNTLAVTAGVVQEPNVVQANFPARVDVGYIFDRFGNYGIILSARGPLATNLTGSATPSTVAAGDLQTEVSNAQNLVQLNGWRVVEGLTEGSGVSGALAATNSGGVATFAASAGYGAGLEYGVGMQYTLVVPLGNVNTGPIP